MKTLRISGKCNDMVSYHVKDADGNRIFDYDGSNPISPGSDYMDFEIDLDTGKILSVGRDHPWDAAAVRENIQEQMDERQNRNRYRKDA